MSALIFAAWIAATVARLATALRHAAERIAPHHPPSAPEKVQWNWCPQCAQPVDLPDECHDGSECRCHKCRTIYVVTEHEGGTWSLSIQDEEDEPEESTETRFAIHETETAVLVDNANGETVAAFSKLCDGDVTTAVVTDEATERARADAKRYVAEAHPPAPEDEAAVSASWGDGGCGLGADGQPVEEPGPAPRQRRTFAGPLADTDVLHLGRESDVDVTIACGTTVAGRRPWTDTREALDADPNPCLACRAIDDAEQTAADVADPRCLARACLAAEGAAPAPGWPAGRAVAHGYLATALLPALPADLRVRLGRWRAAVATPKRPAPTELHYVRDYHTTICGGPLGGASRATGSPQMWHAEPPATRCPTCAAELRRADPHRFDTRLQGITDTSGDADELLSREPPFAGRGGSL